MNNPARISRQPVPELLDLVRALARMDEARDYQHSITQGPTHAIRPDPR